MTRKIASKRAGKNSTSKSTNKKIRTPGDKLFTHQFQTAERILAPDWAEKFSAQSGASIRSAARFDFRLRPHNLPLGLRGWGRTWNRAELSYECFIINLFANCSIRTWSRAELSYECFIINLFTNCRGRTWSRAGPSTSVLTPDAR